MLNNINYELDLYNNFGYTHIAGIDEVGRGAIAGPFVVCAVILDLPKIFSLFDLPNQSTNIITNHRNNDVSFDKITSNHGRELEQKNLYSKITDSKKLTTKSRSLLSDFLKKEALTYAIVEISNNELDKLGISAITQLAFTQAITKLKTAPNHILTDRFPIAQIDRTKQTNITKGDVLSITIGSASILAKVHRDNIMIKLSRQYPNYKLENHKGYGTKIHIEALGKHGPSGIHRRSFEPVKSMVLP